MTKIYDLHCHSNFSDGILSPEELVSRAKSKEVAVLSLTDHDTCAGLARAAKHAEDIGIELITGIEFSCLWNGRNIHIVGLNFDLEHEPLKNAVRRQHDARMTRAKVIADKLAAQGIAGAFEGAKRYAGEGVIGRPHFAQYLVESKAVKNMNQAFKRYLGAGKPGDVKQQWPEIAVAIDWITSSGGAAVLAHPAKYDMTRTKLCQLIEDFKEAGGQAIEVVSGKQTRDITGNMIKLIHQYELHGSCGSDFHTPQCGWNELGGGGVMPENVEPVWALWQ